jgi:cardiolipin synthase
VLAGLLAGCASPSVSPSGSRSSAPSAVTASSRPGPAGSGPAPGATVNPPGPTTLESPAGPGSGATGLSLVVEPDAGPARLYQLLASPRQSLDLAIYELKDEQAESVLAADAARGVRVRVLLDASLEKSANQAAYDYLTAHGVSVAWSGAFHAFHEKAFVIDSRQAVVMTLNLTSYYYSDTRDLAVIDDSASDATAMEATFTSDFKGVTLALPPSGADLLWSPGARAPMVALIDSARTSLVLESEELSDPAVVDALVAAAQRGVEVRVIMVDQASYRRAFSRIVDAGGHVALYPESGSLYIHAKAMVVDDTTAFVGSENLSTASLQYDRELGVVSDQDSFVSSLASVLDGDFSHAPEAVTGQR